MFAIWLSDKYLRLKGSCFGNVCGDSTNGGSLWGECSFVLKSYKRIKRTSKKNHNKPKTTNKRQSLGNIRHPMMRLIIIQRNSLHFVQIEKTGLR